MKPLHRRILVAFCIAALIILIRVFGLQDILTLEAFRPYRHQLAAITAEHYIPAVVLFIAVYIVVTALSIPGAALLSLAAGFLFGFIGVLYVNIGATIGAILAFLVARYLIGDWIQRRYGERFALFNREIAENGYHYLLTLRLIPLFPFFLVNIFAGITRMPLTTYTWITMVGIAPASFVFIYAGRQLGSVDKPIDILSWQIVVAFALLGGLALSPVLFKKLLKKNIHS